MLDLDTWQEVLETMRRNALRSSLTAFSVAWGIFMLVVLLGSGEGLRHGVEHQFRDDATNSLWVYSGKTSLPFAGLPPGRPIRFDNADHDEIASRVEDVGHSTGRFYPPGGDRVRRGAESGSFDIRAVHPGHLHLENTIVTKGRFLDPLDLEEHRKVAVIGEAVEQALFGDEPAVGGQVEVNGIPFTVVGVFRDEGGQGEMEKVYLPITTAQRAYGGRDDISQFMVTTGQAGLERSRAMAREIRTRLARRHRFSPEDPTAVRVRNNLESFQRFQALMNGIRLFVWMIGIGTILAGVVGVSNIMMITVRERTREIGVRKALGATPGSIVRLVLQESVLLTAVAGYLGLVLGVAALELGARHLPSSEFFRDPSVDLGVAVQATVVLVLAGTLAGLVPARRAAAVRPVEALRDE